ncbi:hypothetical protein A9R05_41910 (plasmid) [Burkholderia sp. KK1]|uniref:Uncharacterized protein n=1 Tax=Burkholderia sp. M701 TaxID=326454 RepID=V5YMN8_9BURK|nr:hypothetical protein [Burkholderia sp. M701]AQH05582.1 hypothetical protein A9R05_41910 [Burkholderia sp. KK1]BAO18845.1 hypothetical protein [Burkholderia sp. M701]
MNQQEGLNLKEVRLRVAQHVLGMYVLGDAFDPRNITRHPWNTENLDDLQCFVFAHYWVGDDLNELKFDFHVKFDAAGNVMEAYARAPDGKLVGKRGADTDARESVEGGEILETPPRQQNFEGMDDAALRKFIAENPKYVSDDDPVGTRDDLLATARLVVDRMSEDLPGGSNTGKQLQTVRDAINFAFWPDLHPEIAGIEPDCVVGEAVVALLKDVEAICTRVYASDGGAIESDIVASMKDLAYRQCNVWYFG